MATDITAYLLFMAGSAVLCFALFVFSAKRQMKLSGRRAATLGAVSFGLAVLLGVFCSKLLYFIFRAGYLLNMDFGGWLLSLKAGELSYYGAAAGVCLAVFLAAKILGEKPGKALNAFAAAGALLAALARFAEYWLGSLGAGDFIEEALPFPLAISEVWNPDYPEYYLAIFMLEGILSLRVAVFALQNRKDRLCFLRTVFYLCLLQVICESMRATSIRWLFVRYEQLLCFLIAEGILVWYALAGRKKGVHNWGAAAFGLLVCALTVLEEFMLDGKVTPGGYALPPVVIYGFMAWGLLELAVFEHTARKKLDIA